MMHLRGWQLGIVPVRWCERNRDKVGTPVSAPSGGGKVRVKLAVTDLVRDDHHHLVHALLDDLSLRRRF